MDIQLDQMDSRNARKVAESGANKKMRGFMGKVHATNGLYGDKNKNNKKNGGEKDNFSTNKNGVRTRLLEENVQTISNIT